MSNSRSNARELVRALGIGNFNATMVIHIIFIAPATTDPRSAAVILIVKHIQKILAQLGLDVPQSGYIDNRTAQALERVCGFGWEQRPWADVAQAVLRARDTGVTWQDEVQLPPNYGPSKMQLGGLGFVNPLPDVPGGLLTYAVVGMVGYHLWKKRKR